MIDNNPSDDIIQCVVNDYSSRMCERGTKGCTKEHDVQLENYLIELHKAAFAVLQIVINFPDSDGRVKKLSRILNQ